MPKFSSNEKKPRSYFSDVSFGFKDCDDAGPEDGQRRDVVGEDAERAGERGDVDLLHRSVLEYEHHWRKREIEDFSLHI